MTEAHKNTAMTCIQHAYWRLVGNDLESTARFLKEATVAINKARMRVRTEECVWCNGSGECHLSGEVFPCEECDGLGRVYEGEGV
jgi:hypothetical protein